jgi:hypothetical protein
VTQIRETGWTATGADAAYLVNQLPGTVPAKTYYSSARGDYDTAALSADQNQALAAGYVLQQTEGYLFTAQYSSQDVVPMTLFWHSGRADNFTTYTGVQGALASGYAQVDVQGYGLAPLRDVAGATLYNTWETLPGAALDIGVGNDAVWIVGSNNTLFKWDSTANTWIQSTGTANRIAVQPDGIPWDVQANGNIYQRSSNDATSGTWIQHAGCATDIGIGSEGSVWIVGCTPAGGGYGMFKWSGTNWVMDATGGSGTRIAVDSTGKPWLVNNAGSIFKRTSGDANAGAWQVVAGGARDVGVGPAGYPWIIGTSSTTGGFNIFARDEQLGTWFSVPGGATQIAVGRDGRPWTTDASGVIRRAAN